MNTIGVRLCATVLAIFSLAFGTASTAMADLTRMKMQCQQNLRDGRILVANGNLLPDGMGFKVIEYTPSTKPNDAWSYGECLIELKKI